MTVINPYARYFEPYQPPETTDPNRPSTFTQPQPSATAPLPNALGQPSDTITFARQSGQTFQPIQYGGLSQAQLRLIATMEAEAAAAAAAGHNRNSSTTIVDEFGNQTEVVVVTAQRNNSYSHLMAYGGLTGSAENARRDMQFAMAGPKSAPRCWA